LVKMLVEVDLKENVADFVKSLAAFLKTKPEEFLAEVLNFYLRPDNIENNIEEIWLDYKDILEAYGLSAKPSNRPSS